MLTVRSVWRAVVVIGLVLLAANNCPTEARAATLDLAQLAMRIMQLSGQGKFAEAEPLAKRYVALARQKLGEDAEYAIATLLLAGIYSEEGHYSEAEPLYNRAVAIFEKPQKWKQRPNLGIVARSVNDLGTLYVTQDRFAEAEQLYKRGIAVEEKAVGVDQKGFGIILGQLAGLYVLQGRFAEAEPLFKRALAMDEKAYGAEHRSFASALSSLAQLYAVQGRLAEAEQFYKRALAIHEKGAERNHPDVASLLDNFAQLYVAQGRYAEAEQFYKRALVIVEKAVGAKHYLFGVILNDLADLHSVQGRYAEAEPLYKRAIAITEKALAPDHAVVARPLNSLARFNHAQGRFAEAEQLYKRALAIHEKALGPDHPGVAQDLDNLARLAFAQSDWAQAADFWRRATKIIERRTERGLASEGGSVKGEAARSSWYFSGLVKMTDRLAPLGHADRPMQAREMFETAQWAQASEAASSLAQMTARTAKGDTALAGLARERQDLVAEWQIKDKQLIAAKSQEPAMRKPDTEKALSDRIAVIGGRLKTIDAQFAKDFPEYASLTSPKPTSVTKVQALLQPNEVLVLFLDTSEWMPVPEETFIWVVTKGEMRWVKSKLGTKALTERVTALRCGLDDEEWVGIEKPARCAKLLTVAKPGEKDPLPFSLGMAHELYEALFGSVEDLIKGKHLLIVPAGPLASLPFQVLVTEKPGTAMPNTYSGYRDVAWLGKRQPLTVLPSVGSLRALREFAKGGRGSQDYIGYGDPVLVGDGSCRKITARETCPSRETAVAQAAGQMHQPRSRSVRRSPILTEVFSKGAGSEAVLTQVRALCPLEDTAYEVKCIADSLPKSKIRIRGDATVASIKALSDSGELASYRVVHFATHGLLAGDVELMTRLQGEPALVLTPPQKPKDIDDNGLLTASKVAELKLNADWVVHSACNTAAGDKLGAEALSGLARAFFYAGARALLVSYWPVYSDAAVRLTTRAFVQMERDAGVTRAEAMRRSMVALMDDASEEDNAHPSVWAPFVLVGEGGR
jgi:CHAT domain-containing protein/tetratricopeptide (TPR) repeat protein